MISSRTLKACTCDSLMFSLYAASSSRGPAQQGALLDRICKFVPITHEPVSYAGGPALHLSQLGVVHGESLWQAASLFAVFLVDSTYSS